MGLKGMETRMNLSAANIGSPLQKSEGHVPFDDCGSNAVLPLWGAVKRFESAFNNAPIGMALIDMDGRWLQVNNALCRMTGHAESKLRTETLRSFTHPDDINLDLPLLRQLLDGEIASYQIEKRCLCASGQFIRVMITVSLVRDEGGRALYQIMQFQDISERMELAGRLEYLVDHDYLTFGAFQKQSGVVVQK
jgi:PAS domain S-box-containing protein